MWGNAAMETFKGSLQRPLAFYSHWRKLLQGGELWQLCKEWVQSPLAVGIGRGWEGCGERDHMNEVPARGSQAQPAARGAAQKPGINFQGKTQEPVFLGAERSSSCLYVIAPGPFPSTAGQAMDPNIPSPVLSSPTCPGLRAQAGLV